MDEKSRSYWLYVCLGLVRGSFDICTGSGGCLKREVLFAGFCVMIMLDGIVTSQVNLYLSNTTHSYTYTKPKITMNIL
ncbi:Protein of unknown function [Pyronema omphalodes CBS 100304]|uniref:Uncharacterized protein n=1 Tax=Pyronema omphalodes (strain CBS 100304) TaxID=1076935 RepID=U4KXM4_PYROM|nr:Protein of unknown function [Pyronema omphalodes CBS 100304]